MLWVYYKPCGSPKDSMYINVKVNWRIIREVETEDDMVATKHSS